MDMIYSNGSHVEGIKKSLVYKIQPRKIREIDTTTAS